MVPRPRVIASALLFVSMYVGVAVMPIPGLGDCGWHVPPAKPPTSTFDHWPPLPPGAGWPAEGLWQKMTSRCWLPYDGTALHRQLLQAVLLGLALCIGPLPVSGNPVWVGRLARRKSQKTCQDWREDWLMYSPGKSISCKAWSTHQANAWTCSSVHEAGVSSAARRVRSGAAIANSKLRRSCKAVPDPGISQ